MVMGKPFTTASPVIASFNYTDIADGTGNILIYTWNYIDNATPKYGLISGNTLSSSVVSPQGAAAAVTPAFLQVLDLDFDLTPFVLPRELKGIVRGSITLGGRTTAAAPNSFSVYAIVRLRHWDGATETTIASMQTETWTAGGGAINVKESKVVGFSLDATAGQHFAEDDQLRVTVEIWGQSTGGGKANVGFGCDPTARADETAVNGGIIESTDTTLMKLNVPFKIDNV